MKCTSKVPVPKSSRNLLLDLPLELRDEVYKYAFGYAPRAFVAREDITVYGLASDSIDAYHAYIRYPETVKGLPIWILGCKQILNEAMDLFRRSRTYVVEASDRYPSIYLSAYGEALPVPHLNTLSYGGKGNINSLTFQPGSKMWPLVGYYETDIASVFSKAKDLDSELLDQVHRGLDRDACLQLKWEYPCVRWHGSLGSNNVDWLEAEKEILCCFDAKWNGRFRKVSVAIKYPETHKTMIGRMVELAEKFSQRLVGGTQEAELKFYWIEEAGYVNTAHTKYNACVKTLVVERKI
jgi:hypothetical protein